MDMEEPKEAVSIELRAKREKDPVHTAVEEAQAYRDGYRQGYALGLEDGRGQGYANAKARAWLAYDALEASATLANNTLEKVSTAIAALVGGR